jgi:hypothetical protein
MATKKTATKAATKKTATKKKTPASRAIKVGALKAKITPAGAAKLEVRAASSVDENPSSAHELWAVCKDGTEQRVCIVDDNLVAHIKGGGMGRYKVAVEGFDRTPLVELST